MKASPATRLAGRTFDVQVLNLPAPGKDQDAWLVSDDFVAVADGATPLGDEPASAVREYAKTSLEALWSERSQTAGRMVRVAVEKTMDLAIPHTPPLSCTVALARTVSTSIEVVILGDCTAVVAYQEGRRRTIRDLRLPRVDAVVIEKLRDLTKGGLSPDDARLAITDDLTANRLQMNRADSYWSFSGERAAGRHVLHRLLAPDDVLAILLCSDGFARLADTFHAASGMTGLLDRCRKEGLAALGAELRSLELAPRSMTDYPRFGTHDDATAVLLSR
jgi:hypothetical protein